MDYKFWQGKKVFITGHTGFKGSWLCLWLSLAGAEVAGYALKPPTMPSLFELCKIDKLVKSIYCDIRNRDALNRAINDFGPEVVIHMAAQPIVRESYKIPIETYETNLMGTIYLLEAVRQMGNVRSLVNVTTDKCYENKEWIWGYRENEPMGGYDPYSNSKACSELVTASYRNSYFNANDYARHGVGIATARAGNVIGGGDWATDRLIPDCVRSILDNRNIIIRNPGAIRPWQHVLEPLNGYLILAQKLYEEGDKYSEAWNFGPNDNDVKSVGWVVETLCKMSNGKTDYIIDETRQPHEANYLKLDCSKAKSRLGWYPRWNLDKALEKVVEWTLAYKQENDLQKTCFMQIREYEACKLEE